MADPDQPKHLYSASELIDLEVPETNFYLEPYIPTEGIVLLFGKPSTYKTTLVYTMANAIATGCNIWGKRADRTGKVLILELDTPLQVVKTRFSPALTRESQVDTFFHHGVIDIVGRKSAYDAQLWGELSKAHARSAYSVVFVDILMRTHTLDEKEAQSVSPVYVAFQQLFPGATIVFVHHANKSHKDDTEEMKMESFGGSIQWSAQAQVVLQVVLEDRDKSIVSLHVTKSQVAERTAPVRLQVTGWQVKLEGEARVDLVAKAMQNLPTGLTKRALDRELATYLGVSEKTARSRRLEWEKGQPIQLGQIHPFPVAQPQATDNNGD